MGMIIYSQITPLSLIFLAAVQIKKCGSVKVKVNRRIVPKRFESEKGQYPWQVGLFYHNQFFCGGTLISEKHVLTAAQCLTSLGDDVIAKLKVTVGAHDISINEGKSLFNKHTHIFLSLDLPLSLIDGLDAILDN